MKKESLSAIYDTQISMGNDEPAYYTQVPQCIYHLTYIHTVKGKKVRKMLSPRARDFYVWLRGIGSRSGKCWMNREHIAEALGCSTGQVTSMKKELSMPMEQLNGKPLVIINVSKRNFKDKNGRNQAKQVDTINILNVWAENNAFMATHIEAKSRGEEFDGLFEITTEDDESYEQNLVHASKNDEAESPATNIDDPNPGPSSNIVRKVTEEYSYNISVRDTTTESAKSPIRYPVAFTKTVPSVFSVRDQERQLKSDLISFGCDTRFMTEVFKVYDLPVIWDALNYTIAQFDRGKVKSNKFGYLRDALKNKRRWHDTKI